MPRGMTREFHFWHSYIAQHPTHGVTSFSANAAIGALLCLCLLACWTTGQVAARCGECEAIPARCRCGAHR